MTSTRTGVATLIVSAGLLVIACENDDPEVTSGATGNFTSDVENGTGGGTTGGDTDGGGTGTVPDTIADGAVDGAGDGTSSVDDTDQGGGNDVAPEEDAGGEAGSTGRITLSQASTTTQGETTWTTSGQGIVGVDGFRSNDDSCSTESAGGCTLRTCPEMMDETLEGGESAGDIAVSGGRANFTLEYDAQGEGRYTGSTFDRVWDGSQTLTVEASGATIPGFTTEIQPPSDVELTSPDPKGEGEDLLSVDVNSGLTVDWETDGVQGGTFFVYLASEDDTESTQLRCRWDATSGDGTVPDTLLGQMVPGTARYYMRVQDGERVTAGDDAVIVRGVELVKDADRHAASGQADLQ